MKKYRPLLGVLFPLTLLLMGSAAAPLSVEATGDCQLRIAFYESMTVQNGWIYCYTGVNTGDTDMESEPGMVMGPLHDGAYHSDFDSLQNSSGARALTPYEWINGTFGVASYHRKVCLYTGKGYAPATYAGFVRTTDYEEFGPGRAYMGPLPEHSVGSFYWTTPNVACIGA